MAADNWAEKEVLDEIVRRIVRVANPDRIVLFGSRARGDARPDSDYDVLVVAPSDEVRWRRTIPIYQSMRGVPVPCDVVWWTEDEIRQWQGTRAHFINLALREGRVLYERAA